MPLLLNLFRSQLLILILGLLLLICHGNHVKAQQFEWVMEIGDTAQTFVEDVAVDAQGNIIVVGEFWKTVDFDPGPGVFNMTGTGNGKDGFILKLDSLHHFLWAKQIEGNIVDYIFNVAVDPTGNVIFHGPVNGTLDLDPGPGTINVSAANDDLEFFVKLDASGTLVWAHTLHCDGANAFIQDVVADVNGNIVLTGTFQGTADFDPNAGTLLRTATLGSNDAYIWKIDAQGNLVWVQTIAGIGANGPMVAQFTAQQDIVVTAAFADTVDMDAGPGVAQVVSRGNGDIYVLRLTSAGNFVWVRSIGNRRGTACDGLRIAPNDTIYCLFAHDSIVDIDPGLAVFNVGTGNVGQEAMVKLTPSGDFVWGAEMPWNSVSQRPNGWAIARDHIFVGGKFGGTIDFDPGAGTAPLTASGGDDGFLMKMGLDGSFASVSQFPGSNTYMAPFSVFVDPRGNIMVGGEFRTPVDFDPGSGTAMLSPGVNVFGFVLQLQDCGGATSVSVSGNTLTATTAGASYQWLDCNNAFALIPGANGLSYTPAGNGTYAVAAAAKGCTDTSDCITLGPVGLSQGAISGWVLFPNPNTGAFQIDLGESQPEAMVTVRNTLGMEVHRQRFENSRSLPLNFKGAAGLYSVTIALPSGTALLKCIVR